MVKQEEKNGRIYWLIHRDSLVKTCGNDMGGTYPRHEHVGQHVADPCQVNTITLDAYEEKRSLWLKERDELQTGLMVYRYKFEEMERQMRLLPAPVEVVNTILQEKEAKLTENDQALRTAQEAIHSLEEELQQERRRSWWDRMWER